jgi:hypothetical protein
MTAPISPLSVGPMEARIEHVDSVLLVSYPHDPGQDLHDIFDQVSNTDAMSQLT